MDNTITYERKNGDIQVRLGKRIIGAIRSIPDGYHYKPKGGPPGETFATVADVKQSIEAP